MHHALKSTHNVSTPKCDGEKHNNRKKTQYVSTV